jgi:hypothetical protein
MKGSGIGGEVIAQYVVNRNGRAVMETFKALSSPGPEFTAAVKAALPTLQFDAAVIRGTKVAQLVEQAFQFTAPPKA